MMDLKRVFWDASMHKGEMGYLKTQRKYELAKTIVFYVLSFAILALGWISTGTRNNLLTIVAVLGILPATKALVVTILFFRYQGCPEEEAKKIESALWIEHGHKRLSLYDRVFTGQKKTFEVRSLTIGDGCILYYAEPGKAEEKAFKEHLAPFLGAEHLDGYTIKGYEHLEKYLERIRSLSIDPPQEKDLALRRMLCQISL
ncbi:MAG: hypothetical protein K6E92_10130 [Lachnospiraceae bacterium]|nr:hypothetical protein [Lachnospiraceae bacterium]